MIEVIIGLTAFGAYCMYAEHRKAVEKERREKLVADAAQGYLATTPQTLPDMTHWSQRDRDAFFAKHIAALQQKGN